MIPDVDTAAASSPLNRTECCGFTNNDNCCAALGKVCNVNLLLRFKVMFFFSKKFSWYHKFEKFENDKFASF